ncbi:MAG: tRNA pseudouridine(55) synthase TruB [Elusimicrobiota bacterium]
MKELLKEVDGIISVYKPKGITSYDVIRTLKSRAEFSKIGHAGILDPLAEGVLLILIGRSTRHFEKLRNLRKTYRAEVKFGFETSTGDMDGIPVFFSDARPSREKIASVLAGFTGTIEQVPPVYSALKYRGKKLCDYARDGVNLQPPSRKVTVYSIELLDFDFDSICLRIECSGGTYIRSLVRDIGRAVGTFATLSGLIREKVGDFDISNSLTLESIKGKCLKDLIKPG